MERLHGTAIRLKYMTEGLEDSVTTEQYDNKWSIKQEIGHLADLEDLHIARIRQLIAKQEVLEGWKVGNQQTHEANHNERTVGDLISDFELKRQQFIDLLTNLEDDICHFAALHPRLQVRMRPVDLAFFTAEHDDHHLAAIRQILYRLS